MELPRQSRRRYLSPLLTRPGEATFRRFAGPRWQSSPPEADLERECCSSRVPQEWVAPTRIAKSDPGLADPPPRDEGRPVRSTQPEDMLQPLGPGQAARPRQVPQAGLGALHREAEQGRNPWAEGRELLRPQGLARQGCLLPRPRREGSPSAPGPAPVLCWEKSERGCATSGPPDRRCKAQVPRRGMHLRPDPDLRPGPGWPERRPSRARAAHWSPARRRRPRLQGQRQAP